MNSQRIYLWDLPTRLFHWLLALSIVAAVITGQVGGNWIEWHARLGLLIVGLLVFRVVWGFIGSTYARFGEFFPTPAKISAYLKGAWRRPGHNPLGALSVFGLLAVCALQVTSGLFANDDIAFNGPLLDLVGKEISDRLTGFHHLLVNLLILLVALHLAAIVFYAHVRKDNLVKPMVVGWKETEGPAESAKGGGFVALLVALLLAAAAVYGASGAWMPAPPPPAPAATTPSW